jgi:hypothetical protein
MGNYDQFFGLGYVDSVVETFVGFCLFHHSDLKETVHVDFGTEDLEPIVEIVGFFVFLCFLFFWRESYLRGSGALVLGRLAAAGAEDLIELVKEVHIV